MHLFSFSQNINIDSVKTELSKAKEDTNKVILYRILAGVIANSNPVQAIEYGKSGIQLGKQLKWNKGVAGCYLNVAVAFGSKGQLDSAMLYIDSAIITAKIVGDPTRLALVFLNRADYHMQLRNFKQSLIDCDSAWRYAELANNNDRRARILQTIGAIYFYQTKYKESREYNERAGQLYKELGNKKMYAIVLSNIGNIFTRAKDYQAAIDNYQNAITLANEAGDRVNLSMYHGNISENYLKQEAYDKALFNAEKAMEFAVQQNNEKQKGIAYSLFGEIYLQQKKYSQSIEAASKALELFKKNELPGEQQSAAEILAEAYSLNNNYSEAYKYLLQSKELNDSLAAKKYDEDIAAMQTSFKVEEKNSQITLLNKEKELQQQRLSRQRILLFSILLLAALAIGGIVLLINRNKLRQKMKEMELRQSIAADLHDEVGSSLSSIHMLSQIAVQKQSNAPHDEILGRVSSHAKETMEKMSDIVWMIKPGENEGAGLVQRMQRFMYEMCGETDIETSLNAAPLENAALTMHQRKNIYLVFKEALNNAVKYSGASKIEVSAKNENKELELEIKDNGKGFDAMQSSKGNGLRNMQNRAKELGGKLELISNNGNGSIIRLKMPV